MQISSVTTICSLMESYGAVRLFFKVLSENDNSKNQVYLGGDYNAVKALPSGDFSVTSGTSTKEKGKKRDIIKAPLNFSWITPNGLCVAPFTQLILYPQYPEVRMSGFLRGCQGGAPSNLMTLRLARRLLFMGVTNDKKIIGLITPPNEILISEATSMALSSFGLLRELPVGQSANSESLLLEKIQELFHEGWTKSFKLDAFGNRIPYTAQNGAGYTLEGMFGITPNGIPLPDYLDWELKAVKANKNGIITPGSVITLMTPEPSAGLYIDNIADFVAQYCRQTPISNVKYFTGKRSVNKVKDGLRLELRGIHNGKIIDPLTAGLYLVNINNDEPVALWLAMAILEHWKNKHGHTAYIPYNKSDDGSRYKFFGRAMLSSGIDFSRILTAFENGKIFYDPGVKATILDTGRIRIKKRNQFRVCFSNIPSLYIYSRAYDIGLSAYCD